MFAYKRLAYISGGNCITHCYVGYVFPLLTRPRLTEMRLKLETQLQEIGNTALRKPESSSEIHSVRLHMTSDTHVWYEHGMNKLWSAQVARKSILPVLRNLRFSTYWRLRTFYIRKLRMRKRTNSYWTYWILCQRNNPYLNWMWLGICNPATGSFARMGVCGRSWNHFPERLQMGF